MSAAGEPVQSRFLKLADAVEERFEVGRWRRGDIDLWPPAKMDLYLDLFRSNAGETASRPPNPLVRAAAGLALPLTNLWKSRDDLAHWVGSPCQAGAVLLGDGVSLDRIEGAWRDRHGEPVIAALERRGEPTFLMQPGNLGRLPWLRPTYPANTIAVRAAVAAALAPGEAPQLPDHGAVLRFLHEHGVQGPSVGERRLARRARGLAAAAAAFQRVLRRVRPQLAFVVTWYASLGPAFALACRREGVLCVDLQHCPQEGRHRAYRWARMPPEGYSTMPAAFWTWSPAEAAAISCWHDGPGRRSLHGGHSQLAPFLDDESPETARWDAQFAAVGNPGPFDREILVALQPIGGRRAVWRALARQIEVSPASWRWWIRRHPSSSRAQDTEHAALLALDRPNLMVDEAEELPLPALLRHMDAVVSLASGAAVEAAAFGVPALFLDEEARGAFGRLIEHGEAEVLGPPDVVARIAALPAQRRARAESPPPIDESLERLFAMAADYSRHCAERPLARPLG